MGQERKHVHAGKSSRDMLDANKVIGEIGVGRGDRFLDVGCGDGYFSIAASGFVGDSGMVYAVDIDERGISALKREIAHKGITNIGTYISDITRKIPLEDSSVDICFMANVLHGLVENREESGALREIARVAREEGLFVVVEFKKMNGPPGPPIEVRLTPEEVIGIAEQYGFRRIRSVEVGPYHYMVVARKKM